MSNNLFVQIDAIEEKLQQLKQEKRLLLQKAQGSCVHPTESLRQRPYTKHSYSSCTPDWRVCIDCGLAEEGWGSGFRLLGKRLYTEIAILRDPEWSTHVRSRIYRDGLKVYK